MFVIETPPPLTAPKPLSAIKRSQFTRILAISFSNSTPTRVCVEIAFMISVVFLLLLLPLCLVLMLPSLRPPPLLGMMM